MFVDEEFSVQVGGEIRRVLLRRPGAMVAIDDATLLLQLASDRHTALNEELCAITPNIFLAHGHPVAAIDLPSHGEREDAYGAGLIGWGIMLAAGIDVMGDVAVTGQAVIDALIARRVVRAGRVVLSGESRGALCALHLMAADPRVAAMAGFAPVTYLPALSEFRHLVQHQGGWSGMW